MANKLLNDEELRDLLEKWNQFKDEDTFSTILNSNKGLLGFFIRKYFNSGLTYEEIESIFMERLWYVLERFNYHDVDKFLSRQFGSYLSTAFERGILSELRNKTKHSHVMSLDQPIGHNKDGDEMKIEDIVGTDADQLINDVISEIKIDIVRDALESLTSREQQIILLRYGLDDVYKKTQQEVADMFGVSKQTIAVQEQKALIKMRHPRNTRKLKDFIEE